MARILVRAAAVVTIASAVAGAARADGISARVEPGYITTTSRSTAEGITTETESALVLQKYGLTADLAPWPLLRLTTGGLLDWSNGTTTSPERTADVDTKRWIGYARLDLGGPMAKAGGGYDLREDLARTEASGVVATSRLVHEVISAYGVLRPEQLPSLDLRLSQSHDYDIDRVLANRYLDALAVLMRYEPAPPLELRYAFNVTNPRDVLRGTDTVSTSHFGRITYQGSPLERRLSVFASYEASRIDTTTRVTGLGGTVSTQQFPVRGLSGIENFPAVPERITLDQNPALIDGNLTATAGLDIGYRASTALTPPPRELGVQFSDTITPVNQVHVWVDRRIPQDIAAVYSWSAWRSNDNITWERVDPVGAVRFDPFENRFEIPIPQTSARHLKVVVAPLPSTVTSDPQLATVLVTEVQTFLVEQAESKRGSSSQTRGTFNGGARYQFQRVRGLAYDFSTFLRHGGTLPRPVWSVNNGLSYTRGLGRSTTLTARVDRSDLDETRGHESSSGYAVSVSTAPLPTLSANLTVNGVWQETVAGTEWRQALVAGTSAELYQGISVGVNGSLTYGEGSSGRSSKAADGRASLSLVPHRTFALTAALAATELRGSGGGSPSFASSDGRLEATATYTPAQALLFSASHTRYTWGKLAPESISAFAFNASPFSGGALLLRFGFSESIDTSQELRTRSWGPGLRWNIRPRWFLDVTYTRNQTRTPTLETRSDTLFANLLGIIG